MWPKYCSFSFATLQNKLLNYETAQVTVMHMIRTLAYGNVLAYKLRFVAKFSTKMGCKNMRLAYAWVRPHKLSANS